MQHLQNNLKLKKIKRCFLVSIIVVAVLYVLLFITMAIQLAFHQHEPPVVGMMTYDIVSPNEDSVVISLEKLRDSSSDFSTYYKNGEKTDVFIFHTPSSVVDSDYVSPNGIKYGSWCNSSQGIGLGSKRNHIIEIVVPGDSLPTTFYVSRPLNGHPAQISFGWNNRLNIKDDYSYLENVNKFLNSVCKYDKKNIRNIFYWFPEFVCISCYKEIGYVESFLVFILLSLIYIKEKHPSEQI